MSEKDAPKSTKGPFILSVLIIVVGVGWLLTARGFAPGIDWIWTLGLGTVGILTFVISGGLDKVSVLLGPFLLIGSLLSILRQTGKIDLDTEVPVLVIVIGFLLMIAQMRVVPVPKWFYPLEPPTSKPAR